MDMIFVLASLCLVFFMILATYDGAYLHLWKFELFNQKESEFEHKVHTIRAILFPLIVWLLFIQTDRLSFILGLILVAIDLIVLGIDAYYEKDSRTFMGGLPKWEYIVHLFSNTFHFAAIILIITTKVTLVDGQLMYILSTYEGIGKQIFNFVAVNTIPGAIILALLHVILINNYGKYLWNKNRLKITCC